MSDDEQLEFLRAGLAHYGTAVRTVEHFSTMLGEILVEIVGRPRDWRGWTPESTPRSAGGTGVNPWLCAVQRGHLAGGEPGSLSAGVWWRPEGVIAYVGFEAGPLWVRRLAPDPGSPAKLVKTSNCSYFTSRLAEPPDLDREVGTLLDQLAIVFTREVPAQPPLVEK